MSKLYGGLRCTVTQPGKFGLMELRMKTWHFVALSACSLLVGCGNLHLGSNTPVEINETIELADYATLQSEGLDMYTALHSEEITFVSALPRGLMTYAGVAAFTTQSPAIIQPLEDGDTTADIDSSFLSGVPSDDGIVAGTAPTSVALIEVDVDFVEETASGEITNIQHEEGYQITGSINIRNGELVRSKLTATFVGNLNEEGVQQIWAGDIEAVFVGSSAEGLYGEITGTLPGGTILGGFVAQSD
jgi:hypothetical protein